MPNTVDFFATTIANVFIKAIQIFHLILSTISKHTTTKKIFMKCNLNKNKLFHLYVNINLLE